MNKSSNNTKTIRIRKPAYQIYADISHKRSKKEGKRVHIIDLLDESAELIKIK